tara:strand:+ start:189 stop:1124 length:936 start_codon:yes stop_codon:yes gene_type:complete
MSKSRSRSRTKRIKSIGVHTSTPKHKYGLIPVNNLTYGNPNLGEKQVIKRGGSFDHISNGLKNIPYPNNDSEYARKEVMTILKTMNKLKNKKIAELCVSYDEQLIEVMIDIAEKCGVQNAEKFVISVYNDINPIILKLKFFHNRIRPFQLANIQSISLNPMPSNSSNSPSYPSSHTIQSKVFADILSARYPDKQEMLNKFAGQCEQSRILMGLNFPSDNLYALDVAKRISENVEFKKKYHQVNKISEQVELSSQEKNTQRIDEQRNRGDTQTTHTEDEIFGGPISNQGSSLDYKKMMKDEEVFGGLPDVSS